MVWYFNKIFKKRLENQVLFMGRSIWYDFINIPKRYRVIIGYVVKGFFAEWDGEYPNAEILGASREPLRREDIKGTSGVNAARIQDWNIWSGTDKGVNRWERGCASFWRHGK